VFCLEETYINREEREKNVHFQYLSVGNVGHTKGLSGNKMSPDAFVIQVPALLKAQSVTHSTAALYFTTLIRGEYTGRFIIYSGITKNSYRKTVGHVFTKPVQTEGTIQNFFFPVSVFSS